MTPTEPTFFDPSFERLPAPVAGEAASAGPVLLIVDPEADRAWAADAAVALATGWHGAGRRTMLADLCLEDPFLHERLGMPNQEGIVDIFLYGTSMARSARAVPGRGFYLISAGTYTPDPAAVLGNLRWERIVGSFRENEAALLLFAPADAESLDTLAEWVAAAVVLGGEVPPAVADRFLVRAWLAPPRPAAAAAAPPPKAGTPADRFPEPAPVAPWTAPPGTREEAAAAAPAAAALPVPEPGWSEEPPPEAPPKRRVSPLLLVLLLLAVAAAAVALLPRLLPGFPDLLGLAAAPAADTARAAAAPARPTGPVEPAGDPLPYSVQVANYQTFDEAAEFAATNARRVPEAQLFVVVEEDRGMTWWRVMAGVSGDTTEVLALRDRLISEGILEEETFGGRYDLIQRRPLAYEVGEYPSAAAARARADSLGRRALPAYVAPVPYTDGSERWRVYAGAYRDSASAAPMETLLRGATIEPKLVERTGRPPASPK